MFSIRLFALALCLFAISSSESAPSAEPNKTPAEEPKKAPVLPCTEPEGVPLELKIINLSSEPYDVHYYGDPLRVFREKIVQREKEGRPIEGFEVELALEIRNTGAEAIQVWVSGDDTLLTLDLKGVGARTAEKKLPPPTETIAPKAVTIPAGKTHRIPLTRLEYGFRNESNFAYVTQPGLYQLKATFRTGVSPAPKNVKKTLQKGFGEVLLKSAPLTFRAVMPS